MKKTKFFQFDFTKLCILRFLVLNGWNFDIMWTEFLNLRINICSYFLSEAEFLDEILTKVLRVFFFTIYSHLNSFKLMQPLTVSTVQLL
jgi:hypothetical protein